MTLCSLPLKNPLNIPGDQSIIVHLFLSQASTMTVSFKNISTCDQTSHSCLLAVKPHQKLMINLDPVKYDSFMLPMIECLNILHSQSHYPEWRMFLSQSYLRLTHQQTTLRKNKGSRSSSTTSRLQSKNHDFVLSYSLLNLMT